MTEHRVQWVTAAPLWSSVLASDPPTQQEQDRMQRPVVLRFARDDFMQELAEILEREPEQVGEREAGKESYRARPPGKAPGWIPQLDHVKLYQPVHGHYNLVAGTLVCRIPGLPDKGIEPAQDERVGFVLRRVDQAGELAWTADAASSTSRTWKRVAAGGDESLAEGEQVVPMFPVVYNAGGRRRRLLVGLVPTTSIESFTSGGVVSLSPQPGDREGPVPDRRLEDLDERVIEPLNALNRSMTTGLVEPKLSEVGAAEREQKREASLFVLLDLADFLATHLSAFWNDLLADRRPLTGTTLQTLYDLLDDTWADPGEGVTWRGALKVAWAERDRISGEEDAAPTLRVNLDNSPISPGALKQTVANALPPADTGATGTSEGTPAGEPQPPFEAPKLDPRADVRYVARCVYERPQCGPLHAEVVSAPSDQFAIASFFDLDAPARPIQISLPIDTSIAALRKTPKNVSFLISNQLRQQMSRVTDLNEVMKGNLASGQSFDLGMICSFSIPIITIVALIVLMIFLVLLNIVFWWLPFFRICFPVPLKAKA